MAFTGFPVAALDFYDDLEVDNTKAFWEAHKATYAESVRAPFEELSAALAPEFGPLKIFRPYRDVRFSKDKTPYKTHQGAVAAAGEGIGFYVELSPRGVRTSGGLWHAAGPRLAAYRLGVDHERHGAELERVLRRLAKAGREVGGDRLKTSPRGYPGDHPRIELMRHRSLTSSRSLGFAPVIHTPELLDEVRADFRALRPLVAWLVEHTEPRMGR